MNLAEALRVRPKLHTEKVEAYGCEGAPVVNYVDVSKKIASEWVLKCGGRKRRVYSWFDHTGTATYVLCNGVEFFLSEEVEAMLIYGNPQYGALTPVAQAVTVAA
jgi:hypothetical protein